ncbi:HAD family hydrolase [Sphingomonas parva]|uniref:HAD family hydrolase n=2 Tax=Sphingomonas parva TaxID=2555898 RepID=A0A4Y8ZVU0_9SPHN|nr:HAD family hydrolase [Sphingomonas parva]
MISHFAEWVGEAHGLSFDLYADSFQSALSDSQGRRLPEERIWPLLDSFFRTEMDRQNIVPGAVEALAAIAEQADIVILTNIGDEHEAGRVEQLGRFEIRHRVLCNRGGKGRPVRELVEQMQPSAVVFVDDLSVHHESVANHAPDVWRLHMIAEPKLAQVVPPAPHAHARIDGWAEAADWIRARFSEGRAPADMEKEEQ